MNCAFFLWDEEKHKKLSRLVQKMLQLDCVRNAKLSEEYLSLVK